MFIRKCIELSVLRCPACKDKFRCPVLHLHHQLSLLQKITTYFEEVRGTLLPKIDEYYDLMRHRLAHSNNEEKDREVYTSSARVFLQMASAESIYYGRYIHKENDSLINEMLNTKKRKPEKKNTDQDEIQKKQKPIYQIMPTQDYSNQPSNFYTTNTYQTPPPPPNQNTSNFDLSELWLNN